MFLPKNSVQKVAVTGCNNCFVSLLVFRQNKKGEVGVHRQDGDREP